MPRDSGNADSETFAPCYPMERSPGSAKGWPEPAPSMATWRALIAFATAVILLLPCVRTMANG